MYVCMYVCMYVYTCITHTHTRRADIYKKPRFEPGCLGFRLRGLRQRSHRALRAFRRLGAEGFKVPGPPQLVYKAL